MARVMLAAVFFILIMALGASAMSLQGDSLGKNYIITGETLDATTSTFSEGELVETANSHIEDAIYVDETDGLAVRDANGIQMVEGDDFEWNENNGTLTILDNSSLDDDATLDIDYSFVIATEGQEELTTLVGAYVGIGEALMYVFAAVIAIAIMRLLVGAA